MQLTCLLFEKISIFVTMNELTATYHQNTTGIPEAFRTTETGSEKSPGKINGCFFQGLDYYPYGMEMPGRTFTAQTYRYAYQGSEQAPEYNSAGGNVYTTFFRTLDSRLGRWFTPDVVSQPWQSPYCSMDNNPVALVDPWGAQSDVPENKTETPTGTGTKANPIYEKGNITQGTYGIGGEVTVTASRSGGTSSAPSRNQIFINTFNPGEMIFDKIKRQIAEEEFKAGQSVQNDVSSFISTSTREELVISDENEDDFQFNYWELIKIAWHAKIMFRDIPDIISFDLNVGATPVRGASMTYSINIITRGDPGIYLTRTEQERFGAEIDLGINVNFSHASENPLNLKRDILEGPVQSLSGGIGTGIDLNKGYDAQTGVSMLHGIGIGAGLSGGVSYGEGRTYLGWN